MINALESCKSTLGAIAKAKAINKTSDLFNGWDVMMAQSSELNGIKEKGERAEGPLETAKNLLVCLKIFHKVRYLQSIYIYIRRFTFVNLDMEIKVYIHMRYF